jgi:hypothetical protein
VQVQKIKRSSSPPLRKVRLSVLVEDAAWCSVPSIHPVRSFGSIDRTFRPLHLLTTHAEAHLLHSSPERLCIAFYSSTRC